MEQQAQITMKMTNTFGYLSKISVWIKRHQKHSILKNLRLVNLVPIHMTGKAVTYRNITILPQIISKR